MTCKFRLIEKLHIGKTIRKTKDKSTIPYENNPFSGAKIIAYSDDGFELSHPSFPKNIYLDFEQIPLNEITLIKGSIKDEMIFVEMLSGAQRSGSMAQLILTDSDEYREYLNDEALKSKREIFKLKDLKPGDIVISALCESGTEFTYLGKFATTELNIHKPRTSYARSQGRIRIKKMKTKQAFFLVKPFGILELRGFSASNKLMKEFYKTGKTDDAYLDLENNAKILTNENYDTCKTCDTEMLFERVKQLEVKKVLNIKTYVEHLKFFYTGKNEFDYDNFLSEFYTSRILRGYDVIYE